MNINLTTPINQLGYGVVGLNLLKALTDGGHGVSLWLLGHGEARREDGPYIEKALQSAQHYDYDGPSVRVWHQHDMAHRIGRGPAAGLPIFELDRFNDVERHQLKALDVVFAPSDWAAGILEAEGIDPDRIYKCPFAVDVSIFQPTADLTETPTTVFFNSGKWEVRKGHDVIIEAFNRAFELTDDVALLMNCHNPFIGKEGNEAWAKLYLGSKLGRAGKISVNPNRLPSQEDLAAHMSRADCGVFPARGEGWNLELSEMMAMGKHVIASNCTAHAEYCTPENARLIEMGKMESAFDGVFFHNQGQWYDFGEDQMEQLVVHLREVHKLKQSGKLGVNQAGIDTFQKDFTWARSALEIVEAFS